MIYLLQQSSIHVFPVVQSTYECTEDNLWSNQKYGNKLAPFIGNNEPIASLRIFRNLSHFPFLLCCYNRMQCNKWLYYTSTCALSECKHRSEENLWRRALLSVQNMHIQNPSLISIAPRDIRKTQWKRVFIFFIMISISIFLRKTKN